MCSFCLYHRLHVFDLDVLNSLIVYQFPCLYLTIFNLSTWQKFCQNVSANAANDMSGNVNSLKTSWSSIDSTDLCLRASCRQQPLLNCNLFTVVTNVLAIEIQLWFLLFVSNYFMEGKSSLASTVGICVKVVTYLLLCSEMFGELDHTFYYIICLFELITHFHPEV